MAAAVVARLLLASVTFVFLPLVVLIVIVVALAFLFCISGGGGGGGSGLLARGVGRRGWACGANRGWLELGGRR